MAKFIQYDTVDEVNAHSAKQLMAARDVTLVFSKSLNRPMTARLVDLDGQIFGDPKPVLEQLLTQPLTCPTAVHGYSLDEKTIAELSRRGIMVFRRLDDYVCNVLLDLSMQNSDQPRSPHRIESEDSVSV